VDLSGEQGSGQDGGRREADEDEDEIEWEEAEEPGSQRRSRAADAFAQAWPDVSEMWAWSVVVEGWEGWG
jgi:hypothetical protein